VELGRLERLNACSKLGFRTAEACCIVTELAAALRALAAAAAAPTLATDDCEDAC
jgi:hypothetical protein